MSLQIALRNQTYQMQVNRRDEMERNWSHGPLQVLQSVNTMMMSGGGGGGGGIWVFLALVTVLGGLGRFDMYRTGGIGWGER